MHLPRSSLRPGAPGNEIDSLRDGFCGWQGLGGSVVQWHPGLDVGFAYVPSLAHYYDLAAARAARLQAEVVKCIKERRGQVI